MSNKYFKIWLSRVPNRNMMSSWNLDVPLHIPRLWIWILRSTTQLSAKSISCIWCHSGNKNDYVLTSCPSLLRQFAELATKHAIDHQKQQILNTQKLSCSLLGGKTATILNHPNVPKPHPQDVFGCLGYSIISSSFGRKSTLTTPRYSIYGFFTYIFTIKIQPQM